MNKKIIPNFYDLHAETMYLTEWRSLTEAYQFRIGNNKTIDELKKDFENRWKETHLTILRNANAKSGKYGVDIGCGMGELLQTAKKNGINLEGITLSPKQVEYCLTKGLKAHVMSYTDPNFVKIWKGKLDFVTLIGPVEHFVNPYTLADQTKNAADKKGAAIQLQKQVYIDLFDRLFKVLKPKGRVVISCYAFNSVYLTPEEIIQNPVYAWLKGGSDFAHATLVEHALHGYPPQRNMLGECATIHGKFKIVKKEEGTEDYYHTSRFWWKLVYNAIRKHPLKVVEHLSKFFVKSPYHAIIVVANIVSQSWLWQFKPRKGGTPVVLERYVLEVIK